jgi:hypothetical protein
MTKLSRDHQKMSTREKGFYRVLKVTVAYESVPPDVARLLALRIASKLGQG